MSPRERLWLGLAAFFGLTGVAAGAFGFHLLREVLEADRLSTFQTAARYHVYHALALLGIAVAAGRWNSRALTAAGWLFAAGIVLFSGSLYVLALTGIRAVGFPAVFGGAAFLGGWVLLLVAALRGVGSRA